MKASFFKSFDNWLPLVKIAVSGFPGSHKVQSETDEKLMKYFDKPLTFVLALQMIVLVLHGGMKCLHITAVL